MPREHEFDLPVRYYETDAQGIVHHSNYLRYMELARVELLKSTGYDYAKIEEAGVLLVVAKATVSYKSPARYGDTLRIWIRTERAFGARIDHRYVIKVGERLVAEAETTIASIDREGRVQRIPRELEIDDQ
ncbi:Acyl-CoA thioester hydrolase YbgC [Botrimarina colliarenosi]|uniref:Acyl-CoA thioester hydrolase YbgC n=1 Tax=Botrimarina colliarenosi TaxID=2528001 RepID=A0A5C6AA26_9BACT|nr:thioesterase family protein [Botrimarina colliarenosi]TWT95891.1 Acyl-CoA thioester hydrolase YbgC [Botrimarina colliarenosi]